MKNNNQTIKSEDIKKESSGGLGFFEKYLTIWVALCIVVGVLIGVYAPQIPQALDKFTYAQVSIPVAILIWLMIYPMMLKIDFTSIKNAAREKKGLDYFENVFLAKFNGITVVGLLLTLIILFAFQGQKIIDNPLHIALIAIPLTIQTFFIFFLAYLWAKAWKLPHNIAAPGAMIGASNFFELAVAVAISLFGLNSGAALATVVGVLVEVPVMLTLVAIANRTKHWFAK